MIDIIIKKVLLIKGYIARQRPPENAQLPGFNSHKHQTKWRLFLMKKGGTLSDIARAAGRHRSTVHAYKGREWFDRHQLPDGSWNVAKAAEAIKQNVDIRRQFSADCRHRRKETAGFYSGRGSIRSMHQAVARVFGVSFDDSDDDEYTLEQLQGHVDEGLASILDAIEDAVCGDDPAEAATRAVVMTLAACTPFDVAIDMDRMGVIVAEMRAIGDDE